MSEVVWPPAYQVKRHARARHVKFSFNATRGLLITVPPRFSIKHLPAILDEHKEWILKHVKAPAVAERPSEIYLQAFGYRYSVHYFQNTKQARVKPLAAAGIMLSGDIADDGVWRQKLTQWVRQQASRLIIPYFRRLANEMALTYTDLSLRGQSTLWGSCSRDKSIRLNYKLIFLPEAYMRHIMVHELCHTVYMNHSDKFWGLVQNFDAQWREHRKAMKRADEFIPQWLL